jgi:hypothetical protein
MNGRLFKINETLAGARSFMPRPQSADAFQESEDA